jgi:hypothetical protein
LDLIPVPIARLDREGDVIKVREYGKSAGSDPILYIRGDKIFTPREYFRVFGGAASGYIKSTPAADGNHPGDRVPVQQESGGGGLPGVIMVPLLGLMFAAIVGLFYILSDEGRLSDATSVVALVVNGIAVLSWILRLAGGKIHLAWNGKRFGKALLVGFGVYFAACALFVLLGLGSNLGSGRHISDAAGDRMELAALLIGLPFVIEGFFAQGPKVQAVRTTDPPTASPKYTPPAAPKYTPPAAPKYTQPVSTPASASSAGEIRRLVRAVMVQEYGEKMVFPDALIGSDASHKADFLICARNHRPSAFFILRDPADQMAYRRAAGIGRLWENRGGKWFIVYETNCRNREQIRKWLLEAMEKSAGC